MSKLLLATLLATLSISCRSIPNPDREIVFEQCSPFFVYLEHSGKVAIDVDESACFCRSYQRSLGYIGPVGDSVTRPIEYCDKLVGQPPAEYQRDVVFLEMLRFDLQEARRRR
jgi:hypothetical protein